MTDKKEIERLIEAELAEANATYPLFHSPHEAFAVTYEEIQEFNAEAKMIKNKVRALWYNVKTDAPITEDAKIIYEYACRAIQECIQVAAMAKKIQDSL